MVGVTAWPATLQVTLICWFPEPADTEISSATVSLAEAMRAMVCVAAVSLVSANDDTLLLYELDTEPFLYLVTVIFSLSMAISVAVVLAFR